MNFEKLSLLLYKYIRLQNTKFVNTFDYILEIAKVFPNIQNITLYLKNVDKLIRLPILGHSSHTIMIDENFVANELMYEYLHKDKKYLFSHQVGDFTIKEKTLKKPYHQDKILIPLYIDQIDNPPIKIGLISFCGKNLVLEKTQNTSDDIKETMIFLASVFSSVSQMVYNRFDKLTSLLTRKEFDFELNELILKKPKQISVILMDIDHFKQINDKYGHASGDMVLRQISLRITESIRTKSRPNKSRDIAVRWGGEEFAIFLQESLEPIKIVCERIMANINSSKYYITENREIPVTCSYGIASSQQIGIRKFTKHRIFNLVSLSDIALYEAKNSGRNRICIYNPELQKSPKQRTLVF